MSKKTSISILISISLVALVFHLLILLKAIPYTNVWGGRLKNDQEMYVFEVISILINSFFIYTLLQKGEFIKAFFNPRTIRLILWIFFSVFVLNTIGNIFAKTTFEKALTIITLINAILIWKINKKTQQTLSK